MKRLTPEWLAIAEADLGSARREWAVVEEQRNLRAVAFHAKQAAEKFIKAVLKERSIHFPRTHRLGELTRLLDPPDPRLGELEEGLDRLSDFAIETRYPPGPPPSPEGVAAALALANQVRAICLELVGLAP